MAEQNQSFGPSQLTNPTPTWAKMLFRIVTLVASLTTLALEIFTELDPLVKSTVYKWLLFSNGAMLIFSQMWGYEPPPQFTSAKR